QPLRSGRLDISTSIGKSPVELERFHQHGEAETSYPRLVTEEFEFVWIERPTLGEFVGMPRPLHKNVSGLSCGEMISSLIETRAQTEALRVLRNSLKREPQSR